MTDFRRRSVMQPPPDPYGGLRSGLPMPSTAKKQTAHGRMSMSGPAMRAPYPIVGHPAPTPRHSMMRSQSTNPLLMSTSKPNYGRTPLQSSTRRGSMWGGPPQGNAPVVNQPIKDPRPLREKPFQSKMRQEIYSWLLNTGYEIQPQTLQNITGKDFRLIFQHLIGLLDPEWPFDMAKKFEEQFVPPLKAMYYPYVASLDTRWLAAPASMHSWPALLGMLHWLVEISKARLHYMESGDPTLQDPSFVPDEFDNMHHHEALAFEHYIEAYEIFLQGADVYPEQERSIEERYARKDEQVVADLQTKKMEIEQLKAELSQLTDAKPPLENLLEINGFLKKDEIKFIDCIRLYDERKQRLIETIAREKTEVDHALSSLDKLQAEQNRLAEIVKVQNLSPEEVSRMNTEHESLTRDLENLKHKISETNRLILKLEVSLTKKVTDAEEAVDTYTNLLVSLGLFPPLPPPLEEVNLTLELNTAASNTHQLLIGADIRDTIKPSLSIVAELKRKEKADIESERIRVDDELDQLALVCENMEEEVVEVMNKVNALNDQADELREVAQRETLTSNAEATRLERDLAQARTAAMTNGVGVKSRLQALQIAYREQVDKVNRLRDETVRAIIKNSSDMVVFKEEVARQLKHLRDFAEAN